MASVSQQATAATWTTNTPVSAQPPVPSSQPGAWSLLGQQARAAPPGLLRGGRGTGHRVEFVEEVDAVAGHHDGRAEPAEADAHSHPCGPGAQSGVHRLVRHGRTTDRQVDQQADQHETQCGAREGRPAGGAGHVGPVVVAHLEPLAVGWQRRRVPVRPRLARPGRVSTGRPPAARAPRRPPRPTAGSGRASHAGRATPPAARVPGAPQRTARPAAWPRAAARRTPRARRCLRPCRRAGWPPAPAPRTAARRAGACAAGSGPRSPPGRAVVPRCPSAAAGCVPLLRTGQSTTSRTTTTMLEEMSQFAILYHLFDTKLPPASTMRRSGRQPAA